MAERVCQVGLRGAALGVELVVGCQRQVGVRQVPGGAVPAVIVDARCKNELLVHDDEVAAEGQDGDSGQGSQLEAAQ